MMAGVQQSEGRNMTPVAKNGAGGVAGGAPTSFLSSRRHYWGLLLLLAAFCSGLYVLLYYRATLTTSPSLLFFPRIFKNVGSDPPPWPAHMSRNVFNASSSVIMSTLRGNVSSSTLMPTTTNTSFKTSSSSSWFPYKTSEELRAAILNGSQLPLLTLFTTWVDRDDLVLVRNLTLRNWVMLKPWVLPVLFTNNSKLGAEAQAAGWSVMPVSKMAIGVPILKNMYLDVMARFNSTLYAFANGDILFTHSLVNSLVAVVSNSSLDIRNRGLLAIGQRTNVFMVKEPEARTLSSLTMVAKARGKLFMKMAEDFFVTDRRFKWDSIPGVVIGRVAYDNWLVLHAIQTGYVVVDLSKTALAVHQTTKKGNSEGFQHANSSYNDNILRRLYKHIRYMGGCVDCAPWRTLMSPKGTMYVEKKTTRPKYC